MVSQWWRHNGWWLSLIYQSKLDDLDIWVRIHEIPSRNSWRHYGKDQSFSLASACGFEIDCLPKQFLFLFHLLYLFTNYFFNLFSNRMLQINTCNTTDQYEFTGSTNWLCSVLKTSINVCTWGCQNNAFSQMMLEQLLSWSLLSIFLLSVHF